MAKAKYRGYARGKGFQQRDPGYAALEQMNKRDDEVIRNLKENKSDIESQGLQALSNLKDRQRIEEKNVEDINMEPEITALKQSSLQQNRQTIDQRQDAAYKKFQQEQKNIEKLGQFSETIASSLLDIKKKDLDATIEAGYNYYISKPIPSDQRDSFLLEEIQKVKNPGALIEQYAADLKKRGAHPEEIEHVRKWNNGPDYSRLKAQAKNAGANYGGWARQQLQGIGALSLDQTEAALEILQLEYLKINNLYGLNADFLGDMFDTMRASRNTILSDTRNTDATAKAEGTVRKLEEAVLSTLSGEDMQALAEAYSMVSENGKYRNTIADGWRHVFTLIEDDKLTSDEQRDSIIETLKTLKSTDQNSTIYERYKKDIFESNRKRGRTSKANADLELVKNQVNGIKAQAIGEDWVKSGKWDMKDGSIDEVMKYVKAAGGDISLLQAHKALSRSSQKENVWNTYLEGLGNRLGREHLTDPNIPASVKKEWGPKADNLDQGRQGGFTDKKLSEMFLKQLKSNLKITTTFETYHYSADVAANKAIDLYNDKLVELNKAGSDPALNHDKAFKYVMDDINNVKTGEFQILNSGDDNNPFKGQSVYAGFTFVPSKKQIDTANDQNELAFGNPITLDKNIQLINQDIKAINETQFLNGRYLDIQAARIKKGLPYRIPKELRDLSRFVDIPVHELLNAQLKLAGHEGFTEEDFRIPLSKDVTDDALKQAIKNIRTVGDLLNIEKLKRNPRDPEGMTVEIRAYKPFSGESFDKLTPNNSMALGRVIETSRGKVAIDEIKVINENEFTLDGESRTWLLDNIDDFNIHYSFKEGEAGKFKFGGN